MVKIRLLSDIHLECQDWDVTFSKSADIVILAGDIGHPTDDSYTKLLMKLSLLHSAVIVITGNHEYYSKNTILEIDTRIKEISDDLDNVYFLQKNSFVYDNIKFIGCTLWSEGTDTSLSKYINDFKYIPNFDIDAYSELNKDHKAWLTSELSKSKLKNEKICVITHYLP